MFGVPFFISRETRVCGHIKARGCSQWLDCVYILSFGCATRCRDCSYVTTNGNELNPCCKARPEIEAEPVQITDCSLRQCSGWPEQARRGATCHPDSGRGTACSGASRAGRTKVSGRRCLLRCARRPTSRKCFSTVRLCEHTSIRPGPQKKRASRYWTFSWGLEHQDSRSGRWFGPSRPFPPDRR